MKSKLELSNSWKGFLDEMRGALQARDYRKETIRAILLYADPELDVSPGSWWRYLKGTILGCGFISGRDALYGNAFEQFLQRKKDIFRNAPPIVVQVFNQLVTTLFSERRAKSLLLDEKIARRNLTIAEKEQEKTEKAKQSLNEMMRARSKWKVAESKPLTGEILEVVREEKERVSLFSQNSPIDEKRRENFEKECHEQGIWQDRELWDEYVECVKILEMNVREFQTDVLSTGKITLGSPRFSRFVDIYTLFDTSSKIDVSYLLSLIKEGKEIFAKKVKDYFDAKDKNLQEYIHKADARAAMIEEQERSVKRMKDRFLPFLGRKDTRAEVEAVLSQLRTLTIPDSIFQNSSTEIDREIAERVAELEVLGVRLQRQFSEVLEKVRDIEIEADFLRDVLLVSRWELFSGKTPFPDLGESIERVRDEVTKKISSLRQTLINGEISLQEYTKSTIDSLYEHDIKLIRGEMKSRALRLKDLRNAVSEELVSLDRYLALLSLGKRSSEKLSSERRWLYSYLCRLTDPFSLCKDMYDPQAINVLFRYWWLDVERFLEKREERKQEFLKKAAGADMVRPLLQTLDTAEKVGGEKRLYESVKALSREASGIALVTLLEKWCSKGQERTFFCQVGALPSDEQKQHLETFFELQHFIKETIDFGNAISGVKTYEPERIQSILEVFSVVLFSSSQGKPENLVSDLLKKMEKVACAVEDELVAEVGLIDKLARMEGALFVERVVPRAEAKAPRVASRLTASLKGLATNQDELKAKLAEVCQDEVPKFLSALEKAHGNEEDTFSAIQKLSVLLFKKRAAESKENFSKVVVLFFLLQYLAKKLLLMQGTHSKAKVDELFMLERSMWELLFPGAHQRETIYQFLLDAIHVVQEVVEKEELKEEALLVVGMKKLAKELSQRVRLEVPRLVFVPGDLSFFWKG